MFARVSSDCVAFEVWDPVCGCDGVTYSNSAYVIVIIHLNTPRGRTAM